MKRLIIFLLFSSLGSVMAQDRCQQLLDSGSYYLYDRSEYELAITFLKKSESCFSSLEKQGEVYYLLAKAYYYTYEDSLCALNYQRSIMALETANEKLTLSKVYNSYGNFIADLSLYDSAIMLFNQSIKLCEQSDNKEGVSYALMNMGNAYKGLGKYEKALGALYKSLTLKEELDLGSRTISSSMLNIGAVLDILGKSEKAIKYYKKSIVLKQKAGDSIGIARVYTNIGVIKKNNGDLDSALYYYMESNKVSSSRADNNTWNNLVNIGNIKLKQHKLNAADSIFKRALALARQLNDRDKIGESYFFQAKAFYERGEYQKVIDNLLKAIPIVKETDSYQDMKDLYDELSIAYVKTGNHEDALAYNLIKDQYKDSIYQEAQAFAIEDVAAKYETEKKDQEILFLNQQNELKQATNERNTVIIIALVIVMGLAVVVFYLWRQWSFNKQQEVLNEQKIRMREAQIQAVINSEEKERKRFAADLHDSLGQLIAALSVNIQSLKSKNGDPRVKDEIFDNSTTILGDIQQEIRNIAFNLMPQVLTKEGLAAATHELVSRINKSHQVKAECQVFGMENRLSDIYETSLYRILQEWISNVLKYSNATSIFIQFTEHSDELVITVEDNGDGFDLDTFTQSTGNGWRNLNTRLNLINAEMEIDTKKGRKNTTLTINFATSPAYKEPQVVKNTDE